MPHFRPLFAPMLGLAALATLSLAAASPAHADTTYTDKTAFLSQVAPGYFLETFNSLPLFGSVTSPKTFSGKGYSFTASSPGGLFGVTPNPFADPNNQALSAANADDALTISFTSSPTPVTAVGGLFFETTIPGFQTAGTATVTLDDGTTVTLHPSKSTPTGFLGFTSALGISSLTETVPDKGNFATLDNLYVGEVTPEPGTLAAYSLGGLGLLALAVRKRRMA